VAGQINSLNTELNPICRLLALLGAHPILYVSRIRVKNLATGPPGKKRRYPLDIGLVGSERRYGSCREVKILLKFRVP